ncbi:AAA family ATPase [Cohnella fermenti]|uniref:ATP-binding protein n=1 Tax=Cohnella fermenti TaxID=2565925 RepID=A0A4S4BWA4_9BACL|nr:ATP-binding protein [Cohnella fermenti]THF79453.1 ATP-binding protein [Cohnella fermenti]
MSKSASSSRMPRAKGMDMASYWAPSECSRQVKRLVLSPLNRKIVEEFIAILGMREKFEKYEVSCPNKLLMYGPPGTGKTLTAFHVASRLELPLILVRLDSIIHSHLGETGSNIRKVFDYARAAPCVLFLDEFDAIARMRDNNDEVKEMSRVVNTLLQCLDEFNGNSLFMAATNLETELDHAVWRRFDTKIAYGMPDERTRAEYLHSLIGEFEREQEVVSAAHELMKECSYAEMEQIVTKAKRKAIMLDQPLMQEHLTEAFIEYVPGSAYARG